MKEVVFITTPAAEPGFALTGVRQLVADPGQIGEVLRDTLADEGVGVIAIEESLAAALDETQLQERIRRWPGVLVTLPAPGLTLSRDADALQRMVRRALGYHVRLDT